LAPTKENLELEAALNLKLNEWMEREKLKWKQKSIELCLKMGDQNSKKFHLSNLIRRRRNFISEIKLNSGEWIYSKEDMERYFVAQFQELFQSINPQIPSQLEHFVTACVIERENLELFCIPKPQEIKEVVWERYPLKAPGPNGLPGLFFKQY
jgi:hypothetical protein